jgi:hypothetical protein
MKMKKIAVALLLAVLLGLTLSGQTPSLSNGAIAIPVTSSDYACYPVDGQVFPVAMAGYGCASYQQSGSLAKIAATYTNFTVSIGTPVPIGQTLRVDLADFTPAITPYMICTIPAGETSCSAVIPSGGTVFTVAVNDLVNVNFNNSGGSQPFIISSARWTLQ